MSNKSSHQQEKAAVEVTIGGITPYHIGQKCVEAAEAGMKVTLWLPAEPGTMSTQRVYKGDGPQGDIVESRHEVYKGKFNRVAFDPLELLAWLAHEKLVTVKERAAT